VLVLLHAQRGKPLTARKTSEAHVEAGNGSTDPSTVSKATPFIFRYTSIRAWPGARPTSAGQLLSTEPKRLHATIHAASGEGSDCIIHCTHARAGLSCAHRSEWCVPFNREADIR
jgi:hypothetical protein